MDGFLTAVCICPLPHSHLGSCLISKLSCLYIVHSQILFNYRLPEVLQSIYVSGSVEKVAVS